MPNLRVRNNTTHVVTLAKGVRLMPGISEQDTEKFSAATKRPVGEHYLKAKLVEVLDGGAPADADQGLSGMQAPEAVTLIGQTNDAELLKNWRATDRRRAVVRAIDAQLEALKPPAAKASPEGAEGAEQSDE